MTGAKSTSMSLFHFFSGLRHGVSYYDAVSGTRMRGEVRGLMEMCDGGKDISVLGAPHFALLRSE